MVHISGTNRSVHDSRAVRPDRVGDVPYIDSVKVLVVAGRLHEDLVVQVVEVARDKHVQVAHDLQNIQALQV